MRTCDVCQKTLGVFNKFRYADGYICKECYKKASNHFAETIVKKNLSEIKALCEKYEETQTDEFKITGKIGNFLLIDEENQKIFPVSSKTGCKNALKKMIGEGTFSTKPFVER